MLFGKTKRVSAESFANAATPIDVTVSGSSIEAKDVVEKAFEPIDSNVFGHVTLVKALCPKNKYSGIWVNFSGKTTVFIASLNLKTSLPIVATSLLKVKLFNACQL